jgi:signal transduction histidine kinase
MTDTALPAASPAGAVWRRRAIDIAITLVVTIAQLGASHATDTWRRTVAATPGWPVYLLLAVAGLALIARRRYPVAVLAVSLGATLWAGAISQAGLIWIAVIAAFFNADLAGKRAIAVASLVIGYVATFWPEWRIGSPGHSSVAVALGVAAWMLVLLAAAEFLRIRRQRSAELARSRDDQLRSQAIQERMRIARELHDVLAHNISVINVQASTALHLMDRQPDRAREALTAIHDVSKQAMAELRGVLGVLRADSDTAPRAPNAGLDQLSGLLAAARRVGLEVRLRIEGEPRQLPAGPDLAAYRIIQESLTNISRHSASTTADVLVRHENGGLLVQVDDAGTAVTGPVPEPGNGITGMAERASALGGRLSAGRRPDGGFRVVAWLPAGPGAAGSPAPAGSAP